MRSSTLIVAAACACGTAVAFVPAPMSRVLTSTKMQQQKKPQQEAMDLNLEDMFEVFEAADKEVKDKDLKKKDKKEGGDDLGNMLSNLFGGNKKK
eukprot:16179-Heterococcus_DN1.PRE.5